MVPPSIVVLTAAHRFDPMHSGGLTRILLLDQLEALQAVGTWHIVVQENQVEWPVLGQLFQGLIH